MARRKKTTEALDSELNLPNKNDPARISLLVEEADEIEQVFQKQCAENFRCFYRGLSIRSSYGSRVFENIMAPFQRRFFEDIADALESLRNGDMPECRRYWLERTKKASKDADLAVIVLWIMAFPVRPFYAQIGAADREQAAIIRERISHLLECNHWLNDYVELVGNEIRSKKVMADGRAMARCDIMASDIAGAHGGTPDLLIVNELSHITRWEFVENLLDNADGVPQGMTIIATNAGFKGTPAEVWRKNAVLNDNWRVHVLDSPAPWHTKETIDEAKRRNPPSRFKRLWYGMWVSGKGDAVAEEKIQAVFKLHGPASGPVPNWIYVAGLDLGIKHDHSGFVVLGINIAELRLEVAYWEAWEPDKRTGEVWLPGVEKVVLEKCQLFRTAYLFYDPHQAVLMIQQVKHRLNCKPMTFSSPKNLMLMASSFVQVLENEKLLAYDDATYRLQRDFAKFNIVEKTYGLRLEAVSDEDGHADVGTALLTCLPYAVERLGMLGFGNMSIFVDDGEAEPTEEEIKALPEELRSIYEMEEEEES